MRPPITVVRQPVYQLGVVATELLIKKIENREKEIDHQNTIVTLKTELIIRNSTKRLNV